MNGNVDGVTRVKRQLGLPFATLMIALLGLNCSQPLRQPLPTADYFSAAGECNKQAQLTARLKVNLGGLGTKYGNVNVGGSAADIPLVLGTDQQNYRLCMEEKGWKYDPARDPFLALVDNCRKSASIPVTSKTNETAQISISSGFDSAVYDECLRNQGIAGKVIIHPITPVAPQ